MAGLTRSVAPLDTPVFVDEVKIGLRIDSDDEDTFLESLIAAATDDAENLLHRAILPQTWILLLDAFPASGIRLPYPVARTATVAYQATAGVWTTLTVGQIALISGPPSYVAPAYGQTWPVAIDFPDSVRVTYTAYSWETTDSIPAGIKQWIIARVGELYEQREASGPLEVREHRFIRGLLASHVWPDYGQRYGQ